MDDNLEIAEVIWELSQLRPEEVSFVDFGAIGIPFLVKKGLISEEDTLKNKEQLLALIKKAKLNSKDQDLKEMFKDVSEETLTNAMTSVRILKAISEDFKSENLKELLIKEELLTVEKAKGDKKDDMISMEEHKKLMKEAVEKAKKETEKACGAKGTKKQLTVIEKAKEVASKMEGDVKDLLTGLISQNETLTGKITGIEKSLQDEKDKAIDRAFDEQAKEYENIKIDGLGRVLKSISAADESSYKTLKEVLVVANKALGRKEDDHFNELGQNRDGDNTPSGDTEGKYSVLVNAAKAKFPESGADIAIAKFIKTPEGRTLYKEYDKSRKSK